MEISLFDYHLPQEMIAQQPVEPRDASRMMVLDRAGRQLEHRHFSDLPSLLRPGDLLVVNDTRVIPARLIGQRRSGAQVEVLLLSRLDDGAWRCMVNPGRKVRPGDTVAFSDELSGEVIGRMEGGTRRIRFQCEEDFDIVLRRVGQTPLPPYIKRQRPDPSDREKYQTVFAAHSGAVAAPTAGLHFSERVLKEIQERDVEIARITLHVGLGTFQPVKVENVEEHRMDKEWFEINEESAKKISSAKAVCRRIVAVGTTVVRSLESAWDEARGSVSSSSGWTDLFIRPGYRFKAVDALLTNFHLPRSTLLMLVSAFAGRKKILSAYEEAKKQGYRFYSYGDCMFIC